MNVSNQSPMSNPKATGRTTTKVVVLFLLSSCCLVPVSSAYSTTVPFTLPSILAPLTRTKRAQLKSKILDLASLTNRGLDATSSQKDEMSSLFAELERYNPTANPLLNDNNNNNNNNLINGDWSLDYTTSESILGGKNGWPRIGPIVQHIDTKNLRAENREIVRYFGFVDVPRSVQAALSPVNAQLTNVQFERFQLGPVGLTVPKGKFQGSLDVTYLDDEVRLTRGDKGNIFVLTRM